MSYNYRCTRTKCRKRVSLKHKKEWYIREPCCKVCGGNLSYDPEPRRRSKEQVCKCDGYHFPHRSGTAPWCKHTTRQPTEEEYRERYRAVPGGF